MIWVGIFFSRVLSGAKITFVVATCVILIGFSFGLLIGSITGYYGGVIDMLFMRVNDIITAFPTVLIAITYS